jgi:ATP-dependent Clp protease ATP-binding subunit ClpX
VVATLEDLNVATLVKILTEPKNALVKQYQRLFEMDNAKLEFTPEALQSIAEKASARRTGARGLRAILEELLLDPMFELPSKRDLDSVVIDKSVVEGKKKPIYLPRQHKEEKTA